MHVLAGERCTFLLTDAATIREHGFRAIGKLLSEGELRDQLTMIGFSEAAIESGIQAARTWATTLIR